MCISGDMCGCHVAKTKLGLKVNYTFSSVAFEIQKTTLEGGDDSPKEKTKSGQESFEVVVSVILCVRVKMEATKHLCDRNHGDQFEVDLHANDGVDEEEHGDEEDDVGERLEGLHKGPEQNPGKVFWLTNNI